MQHIISCLVENNPGVLARVSSLFSGRGYNIDSLNVAETDDPTMSRMNIVSTGDDRIIEQILKQLNKLIDVVKVTDLTEESHVERELAMIKVNCNPKTRSEILQIVDIFRAKIVDVDLKTMVIEMVGTQQKIEALIRLLNTFGIREITRTGCLAIVRGE